MPQIDALELGLQYRANGARLITVNRHVNGPLQEIIPQTRHGPIQSQQPLPSSHLAQGDQGDKRVFDWARADIERVPHHSPDAPELPGRTGHHGRQHRPAEHQGQRRGLPEHVRGQTGTRDHHSR